LSQRFSSVAASPTAAISAISETSKDIFSGDAFLFIMRFSILLPAD
jgi:hypothetical protein